MHAPALVHQLEGTKATMNVSKLLELQQARLQRERAMGLVDGWALEYLPRILLPSWHEIPGQRNPSGSMYQRNDGFRVIVSASIEDDGKRWLHASCSYPDHIPSWDDVKVMKTCFVGDRAAYMVFPPKSKYVNLHPFVLHLFAPLDNSNLLPDFTSGSESL
jgi:hypothetical protein